MGERKERTSHTPSCRKNVVDSTGASDASNAGLATAVPEVKEMLEAIKFANAAGAFSYKGRYNSFFL